MKKTVILMMCFAVILMTVNSCTTGYSKDSYIKSLERFVTSVEKNYKNYDDKDWEKADHRMEAFVENYDKYKDEFTNADIKKVAKLMLKYRYLHGKSAVTGWWEKMKERIGVGTDSAKEVFDELAGEMESWADSLNAVFQ